MADSEESLSSPEEHGKEKATPRPGSDVLAHLTPTRRLQRSASFDTLAERIAETQTTTLADEPPSGSVSDSSQTTEILSPRLDTQYFRRSTRRSLESPTNSSPAHSPPAPRSPTYPQVRPIVPPRPSYLDLAGGPSTSSTTARDPVRSFFDNLWHYRNSPPPVDDSTPVTQYALPRKTPRKFSDAISRGRGRSYDSTDPEPAQPAPAPAPEQPEEIASPPGRPYSPIPGDLYGYEQDGPYWRGYFMHIELAWELIKQKEICNMYASHFLVHCENHRMGGVFQLLLRMTRHDEQILRQCWAQRGLLPQYRYYHMQVCAPEFFSPICENMILVDVSASGLKLPPGHQSFVDIEFFHSRNGFSEQGQQAAVKRIAKFFNIGFEELFRSMRDRGPQIRRMLNRKRKHFYELDSDRIHYRKLRPSRQERGALDDATFFVRRDQIKGTDQHLGPMRVSLYLRYPVADAKPDKLLGQGLIDTNVVKTQATSRFRLPMKEPTCILHVQLKVRRAMQSYTPRAHNLRLITLT